jgi:ATP-dependent Clp protease protease subunit
VSRGGRDALDGAIAAPVILFILWIVFLMATSGGCATARAAEPPPTRATALASADVSTLTYTPDSFVIPLRGEVDDDMAKAIIEAIDGANEKGARAIAIRIHSGGGSVSAGFDIAQAIEQSAAPVTCVVDGEAASMAAYILQSCATRIMTKRSMVMFHEPAMGGSFHGQPNDWQAVANWIRAMTDAMVEHCSRRMAITPSDFRARIEGGRMWWLSWQDAATYRAVDRVVPTFADALR